MAKLPWYLKYKLTRKIYLLLIYVEVFFKGIGVLCKCMGGLQIDVDNLINKE